MENVTFADVIEEFTTVAQVRALIVLNGMGFGPDRPVTLNDYEKAIVHCACIQPCIGPAESADWRIFTVEMGADFAQVHLPQWLVDTCLAFITDDELDNLLDSTPIENWIGGIEKLARSVPFPRDATIEIAAALEAAGATVPEGDKQRVQKAVTEKVARVRAQKAAGARGEPVNDNGDIRVAIIGL